MTILQITLSCLGILFCIWLYALIFYENVLRLNLTKLQKWWQSNKRNPFMAIFNFICRKIIALIQWVAYILKKIWNFLKEFIAEIIGQLIIRSILNIIKAIFHLIDRIFD